MQLPLQQTNLRDLSLLSTKWKSILDPILSLPILDGNQINDIVAKVGLLVIDHKLGRKQQGWIVTDQTNSGLNLFRRGDFNSLTLTLDCSSTGTFSIWVY